MSDYQLLVECLCLEFCSTLNFLDKIRVSRLGVWSLKLVSCLGRAHVGLFVIAVLSQFVKGAFTAPGCVRSGQLLRLNILSHVRWLTE